MQSSLAYNGGNRLSETAMSNPVDKAISAFKTLSEMQRQLGIKNHQTIQGWRHSRRVPPEYCPKIERLTNGKVRCEELNDSIDWAFVRGTEQAA
jgi:DNA-binding transcriptional regulator YdaS (Cro superfamily)